MRCKQCDYRLWNLTSRHCPECGTPFQPSEFEFVVNSVRFCCPHCGQDYYGTGPHGHLEPEAFTCVRCGQAIAMDQMVLLPTEGVAEEQTVAETLPWLDRQQRGAIRGWFGTVGMAMVRPSRVMALSPVDDADAAAWGFAFVTQLVVMVFAGLPLWLLAMSGAALPNLVGGGLVAGVGALVLFALWGLVTHGILRATGGVHASIGRTYQGLCFSSGANVVTAVPCLGLYFPIGWIWWVVSAVVMVRVGQQVSGWRATLAVLLWPILVVAIGIGSVVWTINSTMNTAGWAAMRATTGMASTELGDLTQALVGYAADHGGLGPRHALELAGGAADLGWMFVLADTQTDPEEVPVGGAMLEEFTEASGTERAAFIARAIADQPDNVIAHRLGDFVLTGHGLDFNKGPGELWVIIESPDPDQNSGAGVATRPMCIGKVNGTTEMIPAGLFAVCLQAQNKLRAQQGLAPLPDPGTVTHAVPAVAAIGEDEKTTDSAAQPIPEADRRSAGGK